ncbi:MAG TPA: DsbA family oxidoreductase [Stellaceae bacterium]|nr:DsbA family oxidoreductase [Stellaceae bacterium]
MLSFRPVRIDIVLDVICPWCFIGKRRLERALALRPEIAPEISWRPFQLNPDMPADGMARRDYLASKFGGSQHAQRVYQSASEAGAAVGILFAFERAERTPNTQDAHRLVRRAERAGRAGPMVEAMFRAYFLEGVDLGDPARLLDLAVDAGLGRAETRRFLSGEDGLSDMLAEDRAARRIGINAVPCFIFEERYAISGAQEPEFFLPVFDLVQNGGEVAAS